MTSPLSESLRIVLAGVTNAGKSSLLNALFEKDIAVVSAKSGTTTDPVTRKIELFPLGPCAVTDTAGLDDTGDLSEKRIEKSMERILEADLVLLVTPSDKSVHESERELISLLKKREIPFLGVITFCPSVPSSEKAALFTETGFVSLDLESSPAVISQKINILLNLIESKSNLISKELSPVEGIVKKGDNVILVTPIDTAAPKGRLILPQQETIRDLLDKGCTALVSTVETLQSLYGNLKALPSLVITDSQAFNSVSQIIPPSQALTSFSILFARKKGDFTYFLKSLSALRNIPEDGKILIMEACSHHRQEDDIGTVKIPAILHKKFGNSITIAHSRKLDSSIKDYNLVIHCAGCTLTRKAMLTRMEEFKKYRIPVINYGLFLAWANGLLPRAIKVLPEEELNGYSFPD